MNIKSLLIGSAAAMVAVSGARAADAVMAPEPEPVEYVRVCDAYGAGFFYIPGTETCLQISGYVWYQIGANGFRDVGLDTAGYQGQGHSSGEGWFKNVRARVNFDARSETEWGTLRSYIRLQASWNGVGDGPVAADQAWITLGGLMMGYSESFWVDSKNGGPSNYGSHSWSGMSYGYQQRALIGYRFDSNGFFGAISLEDDALAGEGYMPDVVAKLGYGAGWGAVWVKAAYDESLDSIAANAGVQVNVPNMPGSSFRLQGWWAEDAGNAYGILYDTDGNPLTSETAEWSVQASYNHQFSATLGASLGFQYFDGFGAAPDGWLGELSVVWFPVSQFEVRTEVGYAKTENLDGSLSGFLRFTRYF